MKHSYSRGDHGPQEFTVMHLQNDESNTSQIAVLSETQKKEPEKWSREKVGRFQVFFSSASNQSLSHRFPDGQDTFAGVCACAWCVCLRQFLSEIAQSSQLSIQETLSKLKNQKLFFELFGKGMSACLFAKLPPKEVLPRLVAMATV